MMTSLKKMHVRLFVLMLFFGLPVMAEAQTIDTGSTIGGNQLLAGEHVQNEVLIKFKPTVSAQTKSFSLQKVAAVNMGAVTDQGLTRVKLAEGHSVEEAIKSFNDLDNIEYAQPNYIYKAFWVRPDDTNYGNLWGLSNTGQTVPDESYSTNNPGTSGEDMDLENAWEQITDCSSVTVAVIDTGINYDQEDLAANMWDGGASYPNHGYDYVDSDDNPMDLAGHGTHVAGTIGAVGNNSKGSTGVCWSVKLMAVRVLGTTGSGTTANIVSGVDFAVTNGADIINMSLGGSSYDSAFSTALDDARDAGVVVVVAAGNDDNDNDGSTSVYPCNYTQDNIVCVAALDQSYSLASFSNYGSTSVDVGAPGTNIYSTWPGTHTETTDDFSTGWSNTSGWTAGYKSPPGKDMVYNPSTWYGGGVYADSTTDQYYKAFTIASSDAVVVSQYVYIDMASGDKFSLHYDEDAGWGSVTQVVYATNYSTGGSPIQLEYELGDCASQTNCGILYQLLTDASGGDYGVGTYGFSLTTLELNTNSYDTIDGTSMASPNVAGLAAMIKAYNPNYSYEEVIESIKSGGDDLSALDGKTTTGKAVDAYGSLKCITKPTGLTATVQ